MLWELIGHEWRVMRADAVVTTALLCGAVLATLAVWLGIARQRDAYEDQARLEQALIDIPVGSVDATARANERGTYVVLPPAPLATFAVGQSDVQPAHYKITARLAEATLAADPVESPLALMTGQLDLTFLIVYLFPLLILTTSADLTASERQTGTLRMMLAQGATLRAIVTAKVVARAMLVVGLPVVVAAAALAASGAPVASVPRALLWTVAAMLYGAFWLAVAVVVNAHGRSAAGIAVTLASLWLLLVVMVPAVGNLTARLMHPVPSRVEFATALREATQQATVQGSRMLGRYLEDHPPTGTGVDGLRQFAALQAARDAEIAKGAAPLRASYDAQLTAQRAFMARLQFVSPAILTVLALTDAAGTSGVRHRAFVAQAFAFQERWRLFFAPLVLNAEPLAAADAGRVPTFVYVDERTGDVLARRAWPLAALALITAGIGVAGAYSYRRYVVTGA